MENVSEKRILMKIRESSASSFDRKLLTTRKDFQNIKRDFGLALPSEGSVVKPDELSVSFLVDEMQKGDEKPVLLYKRQDDIHPSLPAKDFVLVLMTKFQRSMLHRLGGDRICLDSTHGISKHGFELTTLLVIDEFEEGIPVAFCVSSSVNFVILKEFFNCIKSVVSSIKPNIFMTDDAIMFKNAWIDVFGP